MIPTIGFADIQSHGDTAAPLRSAAPIQESAPAQAGAPRPAAAVLGAALLAPWPAPVPASLPAPAVATAAVTGCLSSGDGYLRAHLAGAIDAQVDWPNSGTRCEGEQRSEPAGVRLSFQRVAGGRPNLLFVFGLSGVREGQPAAAAGANVTLIVQGDGQIYSTLGDTRCTIDSLAQRAFAGSRHAYRLEARGFCTQPAQAVHGPGDVLISTFDFAGYVEYGAAADPIAK
jgi:hypothetical protein